LEDQINTQRVLEELRKEKIISANDKFEDITFFRPKPTPDYPDGYSSRIGIHEVLEISETIKELIVKRANSDEIEKRAKEEGMLTMSEDGFIKAARGLTSIEEILRVTKE
jgi:type II secretory ATPase GspE/PulE/Tfp pilus assembly ATPase PilB-like protein